MQVYAGINMFPREGEYAILIFSFALREKVWL